MEKEKNGVSAMFADIQRDLAKATALLTGIKARLDGCGVLAPELSEDLLIEDEPDLSRRAKNLLHTGFGCLYLGQVAKLTKADLLHANRMGRETVLNIETVLGKYGLSLAG